MPATFPTIRSSYGLIEIPTFSTLVIGYGSAIEQRISLDSVETWHFRAQWRTLTEANKDTIQQFFIARKGSFEAFTWIHPRPSQIIGSGTSGNYTCKKTHTATTSNYPITGTGGTSGTDGWTTFWTASGTSGLVWVSGNRYKYDFLVRFREDMSEFEAFTYNLWSQNVVEFIEVIS